MTPCRNLSPNRYPESNFSGTSQSLHMFNIKYYCFSALSSPCGCLNNKAACFNALSILVCIDCMVLVNAFLFTTSTTHSYLTVDDLPETLTLDIRGLVYFVLPTFLTRSTWNVLSFWL